MRSRCVAVLGDVELSGELGKKGVESAVLFYNLKRGDDSLTLISPHKYPERVQSLALAIDSSDAVLLVVKELDRHFGECVVALDSFGRDGGWLILDNFLTPEQVEPFIKDTAVESYQRVEKDHIRLREMLMSFRPESREGPVKVAVDACFNVKGVGTVALGLVKQGSVSKHQELEAYPTGERCQVRSIQVHDEDADESGTGSRVGLALKGIEAERVKRGDILAAPGSLKVYDEVDLRTSLSPHLKNMPKSGDVLHLVLDGQTVPGRVASFEDGAMRLALENPMAGMNGQRVVLLDLNSRGLRVIGSGTM